jgi:hypothetical protein
MYKLGFIVGSTAPVTPISLTPVTWNDVTALNTVTTGSGLSNMGSAPNNCKFKNSIKSYLSKSEF